MLTSTPRAPDRLTSSSSGEATACSAAMRARSHRVPAASAEPIIAMPISPITVRTSAKSTLTRPGTLMISAMPPTALRSTLSAALKHPRGGVVAEHVDQLVVEDDDQRIDMLRSSSMPLRRPSCACLRSRRAW
jgi:hypothetical protein